MKKILLYITFLLSTHNFFAQSCDFTKDVISTNSLCTLSSTLVNSDATLMARDQIVFLPGFTATASNFNGHSFRATVDNAVANQALDYLPNQIIGNSRVLDKTNFIPGSIEGSYDVSATGAANYQFPILISPGTNGMEPKLSINYSSQGGNGILGFGWYLSGLSVISRTNKTQYYDGSFGGISFSSDDALSLDGARLICTASNVYSPENSPYTNIVYNGTSFTLTTQDGTIMEFGNTSDSRFIPKNASIPLNWALNKVTDANGNYIQYIYSGDNTTGEYKISEIKYTGNNSGLAPYNSIKFYYNKRNDTNTLYVAGSQINQTLLLSTIKVFCEGKLSKKYDFSYLCDQYSRLNSISLEADGKKFNPTILNWNTTDISKYSKIDKGTLLGSCMNSLLCGDLNNDGLTDIILYSTSGCTYKIKKSDGSYNTFSFSYSSMEGTPVGIKNLNIVDWNNDRKEEAVVSYDKRIDGHDTQFIDVYNFDYTGSTYTKTTTDLGSDCGYKFYYADIDNNGIMDRIIIKTDGRLLPIYCENLNVSSFGPSDHYKDIKFIDFDGDGQTEILAITGDYYTKNFYGTIWKYNGSAFVKLFGGSNSFPLVDPANIYLGDFNGDGKSDIGTFTSDESDYYKYKFSTYYSSGIEYLKSSLPITIKDTEGAAVLTTTDFDNDGKTDIISANGSIYLSNGNSFIEKPAGFDIGYYKSDPRKIFVLDLDNDGKKEIYGGNFSNHNYIEYLFADNIELNHYCSSVTDGLNNILSFTYKPYKDTRQFSSSFTPPSFPLYLVRGPMLLASNLTVTDGFSTLSNTDYTFEDGYFHIQGKGFLGFKKVSSSNVITGNSNCTLYKLALPENENIFTTWPESEITKKNGYSVSSSVNTLCAKGGDLSKKLFIPFISITSITDNLKGITKTISKSFNTSYGRVDQQTTTSGSWTIQDNITYQTIAGNTNRVTKVTNTRTYGSDIYTYTIDNAYNFSNPFRLASSKHQNLRTTSYTYNKYGEIIGKLLTTPSGGRRTSFVYDDFGRFIIASTDVDGYTSTFTYKPENGDKLTETDPNGLKVSYNTSVSGGSFISSETKPDGNVVTSTLGWDDTGNDLYYNKVSITNGNNSTTYFNPFKIKTFESTYGYKEEIKTIQYRYNSDWSLQSTLESGYTIRNEISYYGDGRIQKSTGPNTDISYSYSGNSSTVTNNLTGETKTQYFDELGNLIKVTGTNGQVDYVYFASGKVKQAKTGNATTSMEYDSSFGDQTSLTDPNTGKTTYGYNGFSELNYQKDQKEQVINLTYNTQGQLTQKRGTGISIIYGYYTDGTKKGLLQSVDRDGVHESYEYDEINRLKKVTNSGAGKTFYTSYTYNSKGQLWTLEYPTGLIVEYKYDNVGNLCQILNAKDHSNIWTGNTKNDIDQWTWFSLGNGLNTYYGYDDNNFINSIKTGPNGAPTNIQNLGFIFNKQGQLTSRSEGTLSESFQYNSQNCLTLSTLQSQTPVSWQVDYLSNGNIDKTSLGGQYSYLADKINAVSKVEGVTSTGQSTPLVTSTTYNIDNKPLIMDNGTYKNIFSYGPDGNRFKCDMYQGGNLKSSKIYVSNNEFLLDASRNITASRTFIYAPTGICAVYEKNASDQESFYYIHTDYLGSWLSITNQQGALVNSYSYDAWGRPRDPSTWQLKPISITNALADLNTMQPRFDRGYTGHEHMTGFGLINMNGRLYDPYLQRFLSPDIYVQDPENGQSYNRYSYCMNNPLSYTDPSGYSWLSNFGNWVSKTANQFGNWLNENHISVQGGYSTSSGNFWGGTPFIGAAANGGNFLNVGYSISNGNVGIGNSNGGLTNFWYPSYNYNSPEQNAMSSINSIRASAGDAWLMNSTTSNGASLEYSSFVGNGLWIDGKSGFMLNSWGNYNAYVNCYSNGKVLYYMLRSAQGQGGSGWVNDANNVNTGLGVGSGVFGGNYGLTANQTFRYAQRINGRVVSAAELTAAHAAQSMKVANALGRINVITGVLGTGYSAAKVYSDYNKGGWNNVNGLDVADAGVGAGGLVVSGLVTLGLVSNPVGWCIGIGTGIYFGARLIYDLSKD